MVSFASGRAFCSQNAKGPGVGFARPPEKPTDSDSLLRLLCFLLSVLLLRRNGYGLGLRLILRRVETVRHRTLLGAGEGDAAAKALCFGSV